MGAFISRVFFGKKSAQEDPVEEVDAAADNKPQEAAENKQENQDQNNQQNNEPKTSENQAQSAEQPQQQKEKQQAQQQPQSAPAKPAVDRSIFIQKNKKDETIIRTPGQINGNQFVGTDLERCKVIVTDYIDSVVIDKCVDCDFILSCTRGSIFPRRCKNCRFIMVCGQFRCKDCHDCSFFMFVKTGPVIEASTNIKIGCAEIAYEGLYEHMERAKLPIVRNIWNDVHDFTKVDGEEHFVYASGEHLKIPDLLPEAESMLPFSYQKDSSLKSFTFTVPADKTQELIKLSHQDKTRIIAIEDHNTSLNVIAEAANEEQLHSVFDSLSPSNVSHA